MVTLEHILKHVDPRNDVNKKYADDAAANLSGKNLLRLTAYALCVAAKSMLRGSGFGALVGAGVAAVTGNDVYRFTYAGAACGLLIDVAQNTIRNSFYSQQVVERRIAMLYE